MIKLYTKQQFEENKTKIIQHISTLQPVSFLPKYNSTSKQQSPSLFHPITVFARVICALFFLFWLLKNWGV
jgi:hypothetical protein